MVEIVRGIEVNGAGRTDVGRVRTHNEDSIALRPDLGLYVVADGAGGENAGNVASALATTTIVHAIEAAAADRRATPDEEVDAVGLSRTARRLSAAVHRANRDIVEIARTSNHWKGMGTTVVAALFEPERRRVHVAHVGDSRCYRLREGRLELLTVDHSLATDVLEQHPELDDAVIAKLPRNVVTRALGMAETTRVSVRTHAVTGGDRYLLCSDGLTGMLADDRIADVLRTTRGGDEAAQVLVDAAIEAGGHDNVAVVVVDCEAPAASSGVRRSSHPPPLGGSPRPLPRIEASDPEILILGTETLDVVPAESSSPNLLSLLEPLRQTVRVRPPQRASSPPAPRPSTKPPPIPPSSSTKGTPSGEPPASKPPSSKS